MTKLRNSTEAERLFCAFCEGYMHKMSLPFIKTNEELHGDAKAYVENVLSNQEEQNDD